MSTSAQDQNKLTIDRKRGTRKTVWGLIILVLLMFAFAYGLVPLYNVLCQALGINGKTNGTASIPANVVDDTRWVTVQFDATNNASLPWKFYPLIKTLKLHPGENKQIAYFAENESNIPMTVQAIPSVTPSIAGKYLKKTECFCFNQQTLSSGESLDMPVIFHIDSNLPKDIHIITLSYTLFDASGVKARPKTEVGKIKG